MENLKIRRFESKDRDDMFNNWTSDEEVARYMLYPLHKTIEDAEKAINFFVSNENAFVIDYNNMAVGSFTYTINKKHNYAEISYNLGRKFQNKGIMSCVLKEFLEKAKNDNVNLIIAEVMEENIPSCKLLEKNGFHLDGVIRKKYKDRYGIYHNIKIYTYLLKEKEH